METEIIRDSSMLVEEQLEQEGQEMEIQFYKELNDKIAKIEAQKNERRYN